MGEAVPAADWTAALRAALAAGCPVAQGDIPAGNPAGTDETRRGQGVAVPVAPVAQVARPSGEAGTVAAGPDEAVGTDGDPAEVAEREAIQSEPPLPPPDSAEGRRRAEAQRRMVAGLLAGAQRHGKVGPIRG